MQSRATIWGYPIHPFLVKIPIALYLAGWGAAILFAAGGSTFWYRSAYLGMLAGVASALVAAIFGALDLSRVPRDTKAWRVGVVHASANFGALALFLAAGLVMRTDWQLRGPDAALEIGFPIVLSSLAFALTVVAGTLGMALVTREHVGISPLPRHRTPVELGGQIAPTRELSPVDAIAVIKSQHDRIDSLLQSLRVAPTAIRRELFIEACNQIEAHAEMEEALFYRAFHLPGGKHLQMFAEDHRELRAILARIGHDHEDDARFSDDIAYLAAAIAAHQAQEEVELLPYVAAAVPESERRVLGAEMLALHAQLVEQDVQRNIEAHARHAVHV